MAQALNGKLRLSHTIDDLEENVMKQETLFCVKDASVTGVINCILWDEWDENSTISDAVLLDAQKADEKNVVIKKIYATGTTIGQTDFFLLR
jgi:hypothetical protein